MHTCICFTGYTCTEGDCDKKFDKWSLLVKHKKMDHASGKIIFFFLHGNVEFRRNIVFMEFMVVFKNGDSLKLVKGEVTGLQC